MDYWPLIYTGFGAMIGFFSSYIIETSKRRYELKREVYFEVLDHIAKAREMNKDLLKEGTEVYKWQQKLDEEPFKTWFRDYELLNIKLDVIGGEKVKDAMQNICDRPFLEYAGNLQLTYDKLIQTLKQELNRPWWQFWK